MTRKKTKETPFGNSGSTFAVGAEPSLWNTGFSAFKRRIGEQLQLCGFSDELVDDDTLMPFYRMGESETYVLGALGCTVGM
ncbi:hypothetical protein [uncultured Fibrobacter sp.]|jgi:hypothetical protein|uniref:hypothetical protein n=1 Tax=uncultured Fibrobacter sp. TaxID=261512 RepID=UPI0025F93D8C|nr:hypothetical protein [uncultured Fibrobacter sp.]